jgi:hypothetical protein
MFSIWIFMNLSNQFSVDGLANVFVKEQLDLSFSISYTWFIFASTADQVEFFPLNLWFFQTHIQDNIDAWILALNLAPAQYCIIINFNRTPFTSFTKRFAKSNHQNRSIIICYSRNDLFWLKNIRIDLWRTSHASCSSTKTNVL